LNTENKNSRMLNVKKMYFDVILKT